MSPDLSLPAGPVLKGLAKRWLTDITVEGGGPGSAYPPDWDSSTVPLSAAQVDSVLEVVGMTLCERVFCGGSGPNRDKPCCERSSRACQAIIPKAHSRIFTMFSPWWSSCIIGVVNQDFK